jgi:predicted TPR repeat methyltransferase
MDAHLAQARAFFLEGVGHYQAGRYAEAEARFAAALSLAPGRPSVLTNLGAARLKLGRLDDALADLEQAIAAEPDNAEALGHAGTALAELGRPERALAMFDRAVAAQPASPLVWLLRGNVLRELGRRDEAAESFRASLRHGGDAGLNAFYLAGLAAAPAPQSAPRGYVEALFDNYAGGFDAHLVQALKYDAPQRLLQPLAAQGRRFAHALDLGCGTGLCGPWLRRVADRVTGIDLSRNMLERARVQGVYDALAQADVLDWLRACQDAHDCVVAADVFIYVGALDAVFAELGRLMPPGAQFCFSVEESGGAELELRASLRYAHSEAYVRRLADACGFRVRQLERHPVRTEREGPIPGLFCWLARTD